ncbi:MAG: ABC transporter substrate-binding protein [Candidatus Bipolaricaulis sp.]|nr:ABC transporter substrate-binding protein [Candidatus Bipolaricaulis sp.]
MRIRFACFLVALLGVLAVSAIASTPADTLVVGVVEEVTTMDPAIDYTFGSGPLFRAAYERLVTFNTASGKIEPQLALSWDVSDDGKFYTFHLRQGVTFHDGAVFDAAAVKTAYDRVMTINEGPAWMLTSYVDSIDVLDDATVRFTMKTYPFVPFLRVLSSYWGMCIASPTAITQNAGDDMGKAFFRNHLVGTGPYKLVEWVEGQQMVFERFDGYWGGWAGDHVKRIVLRKILDTTTMALLLESGDLDIAYGIPLDELTSLNGKPGVVVGVHNTFTTNMIAMNTTKGPLADVRVRRALSYSFDYASAMEVFAGYTTPLIGQIPIGMPGHDDSLPHYVFDLDVAKQLLIEAGYGNGLTLEYTWVTEEPEGRRVGVLWQDTLRKIGVDLKVTEVTVAGHWDRVSNIATMPDLANYRWGIDYPDPSSVLVPLYHGDSAPPAGYNLSRFADPRVNAVLDASGKEPDETKRLQLLAEAQSLLLTGASNIWITAVPVTVCMRSNVQGYVFEPAAFSSFNFYDLYKK